ncbi:MAG: response regulator [Turicibacter sp.]
MSIKVMIVEDDPMVRNINEKFVLKLEHFNIVSSVADINEAKHFLLANEVDLILLDVYMPSGCGLELLKWIREKQLKCDVILITAENKVDAVGEAFRYGAIDYLVKPFTFARFQESLNQFKIRQCQIKSRDYVEQDMIDKYVLGMKKPVAAVAEPIKLKPLRSGLNRDTYQQIIQFIDSCEEGFTAEVIALNVGLARVTVRRYLDYMVNENEVILQRVYGKVGRPIHLYQKRK